MRSFYDLLAVAPDASQDAVKKAYFSYLRRVHPDKGEADADPEGISIGTTIWNTLKDPIKRKTYDLWLKEQELRANKGTIVEAIEIDVDEEELEEYCRCGDKYLITPAEISQIVDRGVFECASCSLCLEMFTSPDMEDTRPKRATAKIVVLGDSGVGKSALCATIAGRPDEHQPSTVGCKISLARHNYRGGSVDTRREVVSLWDIGGQVAHRTASSVFLEGAHGAILVHDLANSKSEDNLWQWMALLDPETAKRTPQCARPLMAFIESAHIPILIIGTKVDLANNRNAIKLDRSPYERINVDCRRLIAPGSTNSIILSRFLDSAIDRVHAPNINEAKRRVIWPS
ncbi:unnamed protein product, partial [Mesorhabditis spiculigera]